MAQRPTIHVPINHTQKLLILSDGKPGHVNQSIAFSKLLNLAFEVRRVSFCNRLYKAFSYVFSWFGFSATWLYKIDGDIPSCSVVISAGSETYYANRVIARTLGLRSVAIMLPRSYRYDFDLIVAQQHDRPPVRDNILSLPVNLSCPEPRGLVTRLGDTLCVSLIIGGSSRHCHMDVALIEKQMQQIFDLFPEADFVATTSRRTPPAVEALVESGPFRYKVIASREETNPIPDFLSISDYVFVTEDSTSMISEAVCFGQASVELLPLIKKRGGRKIELMTTTLEQQGYLHIFDGVLGECRRKLDLRTVLQGACQ